MDLFKPRAAGAPRRPTDNIKTCSLGQEIMLFTNIEQYYEGAHVVKPNDWYATTCGHKLERTAHARSYMQQQSPTGRTTICT